MSKKKPINLQAAFKAGWDARGRFELKEGKASSCVDSYFDWRETHGAIHDDDVPPLRLGDKLALKEGPAALDREVFMRLMAEFIIAHGTMTAKGPLERAFETMFGTTPEKFK